MRRNALPERNEVKKKNRRESEIVVQGPHEKLKRKGKTEETKKSGTKRFLKEIPRTVYGALSGSVVRFFKNLNQRSGSRLALWAMKLETFQHIDALIKVFKYIVLPASLFYVFSNFYFFEENALDSMFLGMLIFLYSNFLPDLLSVFRRKVYHDVRDTMREDLPWYKKYVLLLFAPIFILALFFGLRLGWKTTDTFHNFKSMTVFEVFLLALGFFAFAELPISIGDMTEIISLPLYGLAGYMTHLKVDLCF